MIVAKRHLRDGKLILVASDQSLLGKHVEEGEKQLDLRKAYYQGELISEKEFLDQVSKAYIVDATGKITTSLLLKNGLIEKEQVLSIAKIPYVLMYRV